MSASLRASSSTRPAGPTNGAAFTVLVVPRLLADQHQVGRRGSGPEHGLGGVAPQPALPASGGARRQISEAPVVVVRDRSSHGCPSVYPCPRPLNRPVPSLTR